MPMLFHRVYRISVFDLHVTKAKVTGKFCSNSRTTRRHKCMQEAGDLPSIRNKTQPTTCQLELLSALIWSGYLVRNNQLDTLPLSHICMSQLTRKKDFFPNCVGQLHIISLRQNKKYMNLERPNPNTKTPHKHACYWNRLTIAPQGNRHDQQPPLLRLQG